MTARAVTLAIAAVLAAGPAPAADPAKCRRVAFLVGVGTYKHNLSDLGAAPEKDVKELAAVLRGGGFEVVLLTGTAAGKDQATKANVEQRFRAVLGGEGNPAGGLGKGDLLLVALCGHGQQLAAPDPTTGKAEEQPFFCPADARLNEPDTMVSLNGLIRTAEPFGATTLFLVDACRDLPADPNRSATRSGIQGKKVNLPKGMAVLFSCGAGQVSHQSDALGHGLFTHAVLKVLRAEAGEASWSGLVSGVEKAFRSPDLQKYIADGKPQAPVAAAGELGYVELLAADPFLADFRAFRAALLRGTEGDYVAGAAPARVDDWRKGAADGSAAAAVLYGFCRARGIRAEKVPTEAAQVWRAAAERGNSTAMILRSELLGSPEGVLAADEPEALRLLTRAHEARDPAATGRLGLYYCHGRYGLKPDPAKGLELLKAAAGGGYARAADELAQAYRYGDFGLAVSATESANWSKAAAEAGSPVGMTHLAIHYEFGTGGLPRSDKDAAHWYRKAAEAGNPGGMYGLGRLYELGRGGLSKDVDEAVKWYRKAAAAGDPTAKEDLKRLGKE